MSFVIANIEESVITITESVKHAMYDREELLKLSQDADLENRLALFDEKETELLKKIEEINHEICSLEKDNHKLILAKAIKDGKEPEDIERTLNSDGAFYKINRDKSFLPQVKENKSQEAENMAAEWLDKWKATLSEEKPLLIRNEDLPQDIAVLHIVLDEIMQKGIYMTQLCEEGVRFCPIGENAD